METGTSEVGGADEEEFYNLKTTDCAAHCLISIGSEHTMCRSYHADGPTADTDD